MDLIFLINCYILYMKKIVLIFLLIILVCCGCGKKTKSRDDLSNILQRDRLVVGVRDDAAPFGFKDKDGNWSGFDIELARIIALGILGDGKKVEFIPVSASNRIMKLNSGEVDCLIAAMSVTEQRRQILDFSMPYHIAGQAILVNKNSKAQSLQDFQGKKLIIVFGSTSEKNLRSNVPEVTVIGYKTYNEAYQALKSGKADGIVADDTILLGYTMKDKSVRLLPRRYSKEPYAVAFRKDDASLNFEKKVDYILGSIQSTGRLNKLQEKWKVK